MVVEADPGRALVATALADALAAATKGSGKLVLLLGEAGIGKTTTARDAAAAARAAGFAVRWSACSSGGATVAHAPWLSLLSGLGDAGREAMEWLASSETGEAAAATSARASAYATVVAALGDATLDRPALLVIDDLHWADEGTLQLLDVVSAHLPALPVLVIGAYRDTDIVAASPLTRLGGRADRVALQGLSQDGVAALLGDQVGPARGADLAVDVVRLTAGNPFLVVQVGRLLAEGSQVLDRAPLPAGTRDLLEQRLASLAVSDRDVLLAAAVLGSPFSAVQVARLLAVDQVATAAALERAAALRIVQRVAGSGAWSFVHDLFRQAAVEASAPAEVSALHRAAADLLGHADAEPAVIAAHLLAAGGASAEAARWSVRAGDRALAAMAWEEAAVHHERALAALEPGDDSAIRADALAGLGRARLLAGDETGAARAFADLAALARSLGSPATLARAALAFSADLSGFEVRLFDQSQIDLLEEAARALVDGDSALRASVLARLSVALSLAAPTTRRLELADTAVDLARAAGEPTVLAAALAAHCDAIAGPDHVAQREAEASEIIAIAEAAGDGPLELLGRRLRYVARLEAGDVSGVEEDETAFARRAEAIGNPLYTWYVPLWRAQMAVVAGDVDLADELIDMVEARGRAAGSTNGPMLALVLRLAAFWQRGDYDGALGALDSLYEATPELIPYISAIGSYSWAYAQAGRTAEAKALLDRAVGLGLADQVFDAEWLPNVANLVRVSAALDHPMLADALALVEPYAGVVAFEGIGAGLYGSAARFVAIGCSALGRHDDAVRYAEDALKVNRRFSGTLAADALRTLAECKAARGDDSSAVDAIHAEADAAYAAVGARHLMRSTDSARLAAPTDSAAIAADNELRRDGDVWHLRYAGTTSIVKHSKGLADLAILLDRPGREVHVTELEALPAGLARGGDGRGGEALDRRAIAAYKDRIVELAAEIDDAEADHDLGRLEQARREYDLLVDQLSGAVGIGGRVRSAGPDPVERLRKAVSARLRDAIRKIGDAHPSLGRHLANAVRTGIYCSYQPELPTQWQTGTRRASPGPDRPGK